MINKRSVTSPLPLINLKVTISPRHKYNMLK